MPHVCLTLEQHKLETIWVHLHVCRYCVNITERADGGWSGKPSVWRAIDSVDVIGGLTRGLAPLTRCFSKGSAVFVFSCRWQAVSGVHQVKCVLCLFRLYRRTLLEQRLNCDMNHCNLFNYILSESEVMMKPNICLHLFLTGFYTCVVGRRRRSWDFMVL